MGSAIRKQLACYALAALSVVVATSGSVLIQRYTQGRVPFITLFPAIIVSALYFGRGPGLLAVLLSAISSPMFLWRSTGAFRFDDAGAVIGLLIFILMAVGLVFVCRNAIIARERAEVADLSSRESELSRLAKAQELETLLKAVPAAVFISQDRACNTVTGSTFAYDLLEMPIGTNVSQSHPQEKVDHFIVKRPDGAVLSGNDMPLQCAASEGRSQRNVRVDLHFKNGKLKSLFGNAEPLFDVDGQPRGAIGAFVDVTSVIESERAAQRASERFRAMADSAPVLVWISDAHQKAVWFNDGWLDFTGRPLEEEIRYGWTDGIHPDDLERCRELFDTHFHSRIPFHTEYRRLNKDGEYRWLLVRSQPLHEGADGAFSGFIGTCTDITERRRIEEQKAALLDAERAARIESERIGRMKDEFLATLSHELRTPLSAIVGWSQILTQGQPDAEQIQQGLESIARNAKVQTQMIEDLLDMSRIISGKIRLSTKHIRLRDVVDAAIESTQLAANAKGVRLIRQYDADVRPILGDPSRLQQVMWNLLSNAIKFSTQGGFVEINIRHTDAAVNVSMRDNGVGIKPEFLPYVFERFRQDDGSTTRKHGGLGLGLAIVKQLVELHGGTVAASSDGEGKGSTFVVSLPPLQVELPDVGEAERPELAAVEVTLARIKRLSGVRVLLVDDDADTRQVIEQVFVNAGARVSLADSASRGVELLRQHHPQLMVCDIGMPVQDGYEFMRLVRELPADDGGQTPAIALTAFARSEDRQRALAVGYQLHLAKPVEPADLVNACAGLLVTESVSGSLAST